MANEITVTVADSSIAELWPAEALRARSSRSVLAKPEVVLFKMVEGKKLDTIRFTELAEMSTNAVGADGTVTNQATTQTQRTITLSEWREVTWRVANRVLEQSVLDYGMEFSKGAGARLGEYMDATIADDHASITTSVEGSTTNPGAMSDDLALASIVDLDDLSVPAEDRTFAFRPKAKSELLKLDKFSLAYATGLQKGAQVSGLFGELYGIKVVTSPEIVSTGTPAVLKNLLLHKQCIGLAMQKNIGIHRKDPPDLSTMWIAEVLYGEAVLRDNHGVVINTRG